MRSTLGTPGARGAPRVHDHDARPSAQKAHQTRTARATSQSAHKYMERAEVLDARWREAQKRAKVRERPTPPSHRQCHAIVAGRV